MDVQSFQQVLGSFNTLDPWRMPLHHVMVFLFVAEKGIVTYREIEERFDLSNASASRIVKSLCELSPHRKTCLGLLETYKDPEEGRRYLVRLTAKGKAFKRQLGLSWPAQAAPAPTSPEMVLVTFEENDMSVEHLA